MIALRKQTSAWCRKLQEGRRLTHFLDLTKGRGSNIAKDQAIADIWTISPDGKTIAIEHNHKTPIELLQTDGKKLPPIAIKDI